MERVTGMAHERDPPTPKRDAAADGRGHRHAARSGSSGNVRGSSRGRNHRGSSHLGRRGLWRPLQRTRRTPPPPPPAASSGLDLTPPPPPPPAAAVPPHGRGRRGPRHAGRGDVWRRRGGGGTRKRRAPRRPPPLPRRPGERTDGEERCAWDTRGTTTPRARSTSDGSVRRERGDPPMAADSVPSRRLILLPSPRPRSPSRRLILLPSPRPRSRPGGRSSF